MNIIYLQVLKYPRNPTKHLVKRFKLRTNHIGTYVVVIINNK